jgi:predicted metal-dependent phosphoesterase TrpH
VAATNGERYADLQLHSSASDGSDAPSEVVRRAARKGFSAIALTDHDTMQGVPEAAAEAAALGLELIPGCELSTLDDNERQIDILAYGIRVDDIEFQSTLNTIRSGRLGRAYLMVQRLNELGHACRGRACRRSPVVRTSGGRMSRGRWWKRAWCRP